MPEDFFINEKKFEVKTDSIGKRNKLILGSPVKVIFGSLVGFYQKNISKYRRANCPMYPTCSRFGYISINKYGFTGVLMTIDRIFYRENSSMSSFYLQKEVDGIIKYYDPIDNNYIFKKE